MSSHHRLYYYIIQITFKDLLTFLSILQRCFSYLELTISLFWSQCSILTRYLFAISTTSIHWWRWYLFINHRFISFDAIISSRILLDLANIKFPFDFGPRLMIHKLYYIAINLVIDNLTFICFLYIITALTPLVQTITNIISRRSSLDFTHQLNRFGLQTNRLFPWRFITNLHCVLLLLLSSDSAFSIL